MVENAYDYMSRRVEKTVNGVARRFVYDGWNLISETQGSGLTSQVSYFVWGLDLSGTLQGAGGIGGLLCQIQGRANPPSEPFFYLYDANGNVTDMVDTNGATVAHYEYDPYGNLTAQSGSFAANPFRFSTKYTDDETGLLYYGFRFYSPGLGRWLSRDPISEWGFGATDDPRAIRENNVDTGPLNLYGFVENAPIDRADVLGLASTPGSAKCGKYPVGAIMYYVWIATEECTYYYPLGCPRSGYRHKYEDRECIPVKASVGEWWIGIWQTIKTHYGDCGRSGGTPV